MSSFDADSAQQMRPAFESLEDRFLLAADWTVMIYMAADNNLESYAVANLYDIETIGSTSDVNILVELDIENNYGWPYGSDFYGTSRGRITQREQDDQIGLDLFNINERNTGDPDELADFANWGISQYPADHYMLIIWDHGNGIDGACADDTDDGWMTLADIGDAMADINEPLDIIGFDACLMSTVEVASEVADYADYMVASEINVPGYGWAYYLWVQDLVDHSNYTPTQLASTIVETYDDARYTGRDTSMTAIDLSMVNGSGSLTQAIDNFASALITSGNTVDMAHLSRHAYQSAIAESLYYYDRDGIPDLGNMLELVASDTRMSTSLRTYAIDALNLLDDMVISHYDSENGQHTGLSIELTDYSYYGTMYFTDNTQWDELSLMMLGYIETGQLSGVVWDDADIDGAIDYDENNVYGDFNVFIDNNDNGVCDNTVSVNELDRIKLRRTDTEAVTVDFDVDNLASSVVYVEVVLYVGGSRGKIGDVDVFVTTPWGDCGYVIFDKWLSRGRYMTGYMRMNWSDYISTDTYDPNGTWAMEISSNDANVNIAGGQLNINASERQAVIENGEYVFEDLPAGNYTIACEQNLDDPDFYSYPCGISTPSGGSYSVSLTAGGELVGYDFGVYDGRPTIDSITCDAIEDTPVVISWTAHDYDTASENLIADAYADYGTVELVDGELIYTPPADTIGHDTIWLTVWDDGNLAGSGINKASSSMGLRVQISSVNDQPVAHDLWGQTAINTSVDLQLYNSDPDRYGQLIFSDAFLFSRSNYLLAGPAASSGVSAANSYEIYSQPSHGSVEIIDGVLTYTPDAGYEGFDTLQYTYTDNGSDGVGALTSEPATITITVGDGAVVLDGGDNYTFVGGASGREKCKVSYRGPGQLWMSQPTYSEAGGWSFDSVIVSNSDVKRSDLIINSKNDVTIADMQVNYGSLRKLMGKTVFIDGDMSVDGAVAMMKIAAFNGQLDVSGAEYYYQPLEWIDWLFSYSWVKTQYATIMIDDIYKCDIDINQPVKNFQTNIANNSSGDFNEIEFDGFRNIKIAGNMQQTNVVSTVDIAGKSSFQILGDMAQSSLLAAGDIDVFNVRGAMSDSDIRSSGDIGNVTLGAMFDSGIYAGVKTDVQYDVLNSAQITARQPADVFWADDMPGYRSPLASLDSYIAEIDSSCYDTMILGDIKSVNVTGRAADSNGYAFAGSNIVGNDIRNIRLMEAQTDNSGDEMGVVATGYVHQVQLGNRQHRINERWRRLDGVQSSNYEDFLVSII